MSWLQRLLRRAPALDGALEARLAAWRALERADAAAGFAAQRLVVVDVESSGLDPYRDRLISIGAVAVQAGAVRLSDAFSTALRQEQPSDERNILVHRIGGTAQMAGLYPAAALMDFLDFAGKSPLVGFHADFDRVLIERASRAALGVEPHGPWLDVAVLAPALFPDQAKSARTLDDWLPLFAIENYDRHDALADAVATAQLVLPVLAAARAQGIASCAQLLRLQRDSLWLRWGRNARP
jgi:DNA polymerase-3 subunit epsilon